MTNAHRNLAMTHSGSSGPDSPPLAIGDACPDFYLPPEGGVSVSLYERFCGHPAILLFLSDYDAWKNIAEQLALVPESWPLVVLADARSSGAHLPKLQRPVIVAPPPGRLRERILTGRHRNGLVFLDHRSRISKRLRLPATASDLAEAVAATPGAPSGQHVTATAPVLMVPEVLDTELCQRLIKCHRSQNTASGMPRISGGKPQLIPDERFKRREDHALTDTGLINEVQACLNRNLLPDIARAFHFQVTRHEGFKIVSYRADNQGHFRAHRDNISAETRHRRFGLSVNLNGEFDGGGLYFPEFGADTYCPPAGSAAVFSGSLLHQANPVTSGTRYTLLSFLW